MDIKKIISLILVLMLVALVGCKTEVANSDNSEPLVLDPNAPDAPAPVVNAVPAPGVEPGEVDEMVVVDSTMPVPGDEADEMIVHDASEDTMDEPADEPMEEVLEDTVEEAMEDTAGNTVTISLTGENFKFMLDGEDNPTLTVKEGDTVRIEFESVGGLHDWVVDEFGAATAQTKAGDSTFVEFVADKTGSFEYYCSIGSHRAAGMKGTLIVV